jgi:hypothetical protein
LLSRTVIERERISILSFSKDAAIPAFDRVLQCGLQVSKTTYNGLQEQRTNEYTATGQKAKPKKHVSTKTTDLRHSSNAPEAEHAEGKQTDTLWK